MRLKTIEASAIQPIQLFNVSDLRDVVVLAGPNGVGKSRFIESLLQKFQNPKAYENIRLVIEATTISERNDWGKNEIDTAHLGDPQLLTNTLQQNRFRREWSSSVIHFESDRSIQRIDPYQFTFDTFDPWSEAVGWNTTFGGLKSRFQDTLHSIFRKVHSHEKEIARRAIELQKSGQTSMPLEFGDPLQAFKEAFSILVAPKKLLDPDPRNQQLFYELEGNQFPLSSLSSGEREVVNIVFDFIMRTSSNCIIFFDEPELHLHPELSYKLLQSLRSAGNGNQFIFCTHSAEIITASLDQTVVFVSPPRKDSAGQPANQAIPVKEDDSTNEALRLLGQSIGIVSLGRRIVLIEGKASSLDKQTYGFLLKNRHPNLVLVPTGGKDDIHTFASVFDRVLSKTIWGVDFFMLCDHDAADSSEIARLESESSGRLKFLKKYHLENYFLDPVALSKVFEDSEPDDSWLRSPEKIKERLLLIARGRLSYAAALIASNRIRRQVGNVSTMPKDVHNKSVDELVALLVSSAAQEASRTSSVLTASAIESQVRAIYSELEAALNSASDDWLSMIPGKQILARFSAEANIDQGRLKLAYLHRVARDNLPVFDDAISIFSDFAAF